MFLISFCSVSQVFRNYWEIFIAVILWIFALLLTIFVELKWQIFNALTGTQQGGNLYQCILYIHFVHKWYGRVSTGRNHLKIKNVSEQLYLFNKAILNTFHNFIPNKNIICTDKDPLWFNNQIKTLIEKKNHIFILN